MFRSGFQNKFQKLNSKIPTKIYFPRNIYLLFDEFSFNTQTNTNMHKQKKIVQHTWIISQGKFTELLPVLHNQLYMVSMIVETEKKTNNF